MADKCDICYKKYNMKLCTKCNEYWFCERCYPQVNICERCSRKQCYICKSGENMVKCETCNYNKICMNCIICVDVDIDMCEAKNDNDTMICIYCKKNNWK